MLTEQIADDYRSDWITRCSYLVKEQYGKCNLKKGFKIHLICSERNTLTETAEKIFSFVGKCKIIIGPQKITDDENTLWIVWNLKKLPLVNDSSKSALNPQRVMYVTDDERNLDIASKQGLTILWCANLCGAGLELYNENDVMKNKCTGVLDFFGAQLTMIFNFDKFERCIYYAGYGYSGVEETKVLAENGYEQMLSFNDCAYMLEFSRKYPNVKFFFGNTYNGKLKLLHELLFKLLKEFDRICRENSLEYYLAGGTLLGSIRHGGMIPWDDDIDVMMLREDYERFIRIAPKAFGEDVFFQSSATDPSYHSVFPKLRLNGTNFVTEFSQGFPEMNQGIFIDIFVHDVTAKGKFGQKIHVFETLFARSMVFHKWSGTPMYFNGKFELLCRLVTIYIEMCSIAKLEKIQDRIIRKYEGKNTGYLYDGTGEHIKNGAFPSGWLTGERYGRFNEEMFPIPKYAESYLKYSYGDFEQWIPASLRKADHNIVKINFGPYEK